MKRTFLVLSCLLLAAPTFAQKPRDFPNPNPAAPGGGAREVLPTINYAGGVPAPVFDALEATDSFYNRLIGDCGPVSGVGTAVFYDELPIVDTDAGPINLVAETNDGAPGSCTGIDTFLTLYSPTFNEAAPADNCVTSNDDGGAGLCSLISRPDPRRQHRFAGDHLFRQRFGVRLYGRLRRHHAGWVGRLRRQLIGSIRNDLEGRRAAAPSFVTARCRFSRKTRGSAPQRPRPRTSRSQRLIHS